MKKATSATSAASSDADLGPAGEIAVMERLSQQAAAWLLGFSPRSLRDHPEIKRNPDGTYNGRELVAWLRNHAVTPELEDDHYELVLRIADDFDEGSADRMVLPIERLIESIGGNPDLALAAIWRVILDGARERARLYPALYELTEGFSTCVYVCEKCDRYRNGRRWHKGTPPSQPSKDEIMKAVCPACLKQYGRTREYGGDE